MLLHLTTPAEWRVALSAGSVVTPSLHHDGFIHLSSVEQVHLPANRLFAGRADTILLVVDEARLEGEVRWEPGVPGDPESMRFPHLYAPLPVAAITSVVPYRSGPGGYGTPVAPDPSDLLGRARAFERSLAVRRAPVVVPHGCGVAVLDQRVPHSYEHNTFWVEGGAPVEQWVADAEVALATCAHRRVVLDHEPIGEVPEGWEVEELRLLVLGPDVDVPRRQGVEVRQVTSEAMAGLWGPSWRRSVAGISDGAVADLLRREAFADAHVRILDLAVVGQDGVPQSSAQIRIDGATAAIEAVMTEPGARGRGWSNAVVADGIWRARADGCDLVWLVAVAADWPREWYGRLGFEDVGGRWEALRR